MFPHLPLLHPGEALSHRWCFHLFLTPQLKILMISLQEIKLKCHLPLVGSPVCRHWALPRASHQHQELSTATKVQNWPDFTSKSLSSSCLNSLRIKVHRHTQFLYIFVVTFSILFLLTLYCTIRSLIRFDDHSFSVCEEEIKILNHFQTEDIKWVPN